MLIGSRLSETEKTLSLLQLLSLLRRFRLGPFYGFVLVFILLCAGSKSLAGESHLLVKNPLRDFGLTVIDANSPEFSAEIGDLLTAEAAGKASAFLSTSLVIVNNTGKYIWGFTAVYTYPDWISPAGTAWKHRISPSGGGAADRSRMLAPGARFLITPVSDFLASRDANGNTVLQPLMDEGMDRMISHFKAQHPNANERVEAVIDSVIFEDGTIAGPDSEDMMGRVNERIRAEKDLAASMSDLRGDDLKKKLSLHAHKGMGDEYSGRTSAVAQSLLQVLSAKGEPVVLEVLQRLRTKNWFGNSEFVRRK